MLKTLASGPVLRHRQRNNNLNLRTQDFATDSNPDSAIDLSEPASLDRSSGDHFAMNGIISAAPQGPRFVRALYDYDADDRTSLSFHEGDIIQVITQLESGWWDGVINGVRGWFPSNYCQAIASPSAIPESAPNGDALADDEVEDQVAYEEEYEEDNESDLEEINGLPLEGTNHGTKSGGADFWIPQATRDGRLFYYNTLTGESSSELPLESPTSLNESGPRDRMNVNMPEKTRPPPEMMARGFTQDEDDDDSEVNSSSEYAGDSLAASRKGSMVSLSLPVHVRAFIHFNAV
jgi:son of sevenless